tara:strand:+ start:259 stop:393 length:135 start_codon:yes stop_codon:yes gene_type:complete
LKLQLSKYDSVASEYSLKQFGIIIFQDSLGKVLQIDIEENIYER